MPCLVLDAARQNDAALLGRGRGMMNLIAGQRVAAQSGEVFQSVSPVDDSVICDVTKSGAADVDAAAKAAKTTFTT